MAAKTRLPFDVVKPKVFMVGILLCKPFPPIPSFEEGFVCFSISCFEIGEGTADSHFFYGVVGVLLHV